MNVDLLETSFDLVAPRGDELVTVFYERLFERAPHVRPLFAGTDMARQRSMLLAALVLLRKSLRDLDAIAPKLRELGARHVAYGATAERIRSWARCCSRRWPRSPATPGTTRSQPSGPARTASSPA
jgi:hemoglobin-like flavoprotein